MAGDWLKVLMDRPACPEVVTLASRLSVTMSLHGAENVTPLSTFDVSLSLALGCFVRYWIVANTHSTDGQLRGYTPQALDAMVGMPGFAAVAQEVGWLEIGETGLVVPKFELHNGSSAKSRASATLRKQKQRARDRERHAVVTKASRGRRDKSGTREREEKSLDIGSIEPISPALPASLANEAFAAKWREWLAYRGRMKAATKRAQLAFLAELGSERAIAAIDNSIKNGWTGLFDPKDNANGKHLKHNSGSASDARGRGTWRVSTESLAS